MTDKLPICKYLSNDFQRCVGHRAYITARICVQAVSLWNLRYHDDVIKWKHFPRYWPFVRGIHRSPVNPPHKGQWRGALMFSLICTWMNGWVHNREAGDLRCHRTHCDVTVMNGRICVLSLTEGSIFFPRIHIDACKYHAIHQTTKITYVG